MKRITTIEKDLKQIQQKLDIGANDWTKEEKKHIESAFFEITKVSVGWGRTVDMGCTDCILSAVNTIRNYQALVAREEAGTEEPSVKVQEEITEWKSTSKTVSAEAIRIGLIFTKDAKTKDQKIAQVEAKLASVQSDADHDDMEDTGEDTEDDLLGTPNEYTIEQLAEIIKAKTGEQVELEDVTYEDLLAYVNELEDESEEN
jgi:hypothetical protein